MNQLYSRDPDYVDWRKIELPDTWPDQLSFNQFSDFSLFLRKVRGKQIEPVVLPESLPLNVELPKYLLQEFHNLPNGNYSKHISRGYIAGFDIMMLGRMGEIRSKLVNDLSSCSSVLDVGSAGGRMTAALVATGINDVWGLEPSPYLLQHAMNDYPQIRFIQGLAESTGFENERFDGVSACFLFHEIPPKFSAQALSEFHRILKPGGLVSIAEPAPEQMYSSYWEMFRRFGFIGLYFKMLAKRVHEPFVHAWHKQEYRQWASEHGFELVQDETRMPARYLVLKRL